MKKETKLIIISKSRFCFVPELYVDKPAFNKLNSFSEQLRHEMTNHTKLSELAKERLNYGMNLTENIENEIWSSILKGIQKSQINVLDLGSSNRIKLFADQLKRNEKELQCSCINLELSENEFKIRCEQTLKKGKELNGESILSFANKYINQEMKRQAELAQIKQYFGIHFVKHKAEDSEKAIISEQMNNIL